MSNAKTPQTLAGTPKTVQPDIIPQTATKAPETVKEAAPIEGQRSVVDVMGDIPAQFAPKGQVSEAKEMIAGTPANPKAMPLPTDEVKAYALVRSSDGMWRAVQYKIRGAVVIEARTKEPDLKSLLAAQVTDCLALDMPLFNDEEAPRE